MIWVKISGLCLTAQWQKLFKVVVTKRLFSKCSVMRNFPLSSSACTCLLFVLGHCLPAASLELLTFSVELFSSEGLACDLSDAFKCHDFVLQEFRSGSIVEFCKNKKYCNSKMCLQKKKKSDP